MALSAFAAMGYGFGVYIESEPLQVLFLILLCPLLFAGGMAGLWMLLAWGLKPFIKAIESGDWINPSGSWRGGWRKPLLSAQREDEIVPPDENDQKFLRNAQGAQMGGAILPSGFVVPDAPAGFTWKVKGRGLQLVEVTPNEAVD